MTSGKDTAVSVCGLADVGQCATRRCAERGRWYGSLRSPASFEDHGRPCGWRRIGITLSLCSMFDTPLCCSKIFSEVRFPGFGPAEAALRTWRAIAQDAHRRAQTENTATAKRICIGQRKGYQSAVSRAVRSPVTTQGTPRCLLSVARPVIPARNIHPDARHGSC